MKQEDKKHFSKTFPKLFSEYFYLNYFLNVLIFCIKHTADLVQRVLCIFVSSFEGP